MISNFRIFIKRGDIIIFENGITYREDNLSTYHRDKGIFTVFICPADIIMPIAVFGCWLIEYDIRHYLHNKASVSGIERCIFVASGEFVFISRTHSEIISSHAGISMCVVKRHVRGEIISVCAKEFLSDSVVSAIKIHLTFDFRVALHIIYPHRECVERHIHFTFSDTDNGRCSLYIFRHIIVFTFTEREAHVAAEAHSERIRAYEYIRVVATAGNSISHILNE